MSAAPAEEVVLCLSTAPDTETAERIARTLVEERLIACANLLAGAVSVYRWEGAVHRDDEVVLLMKTRSSLVGGLKDRLAVLHPYEVPELLVVGVRDGLAAYCGWVLDETA